MSFTDFLVPPVAGPALTLGPATKTLVQAVLERCKNENTRRSYARAITDLDFFADRRPLSNHLLLDWRRAMDRGDVEKNKSPLAVATINVRLTAVRTLVKQARRMGLINADEMASLLDVDNLPDRGIKGGIWLSLDQAKQLMGVPNRRFLRGQRNYCMLAILVACGLRRDELVQLTANHLRQREGRWIFENIKGKGGKTRSVAIPEWVKLALFDWMTEARFNSGPIFRPLTLEVRAISAGTVWNVVKKAARKIGAPDLSPHDLRRTCARLCLLHGGDMEQIQMMLGHGNIITTQRYLGGKQKLKDAVNDSMGF